MPDVEPQPPAPVVDYRPPDEPEPVAWRPYPGEDPLTWGAVGLFAIGWVLGTVVSWLVYRTAGRRLDDGELWLAAGLLVFKVVAGVGLYRFDAVRPLGVGVAASVLGGSMICCGFTLGRS